jgi:MraZ protein
VTGEYRHSMDSKGRIFIPAKLREELEEPFYITISDEKCLRVYGKGDWDIFVEKVRALPYLSRKRMRPFFYSASKCEPDTQGRILIPQNLREYASLSKNVSIIGCDDHAEIWDSDTWEPIYREETQSASLLQIMEEIGL